MRLVPPAELFALHQRFAIEEALSVIRHDMRNRLGSIRNANFYLNRKVQRAAPDLASADPRVPQFFALIGSEIETSEGVLESRLPRPDQGEVAAASRLLQRIHDLVAAPPGVRLVIHTSTELRVRIAPDEAAVALYCLIENAVDALEGRGGNLQLRIAERDGRAALEVEDDGSGFAPGAFEHALEPFFTTRPGRQGLGLDIARRIAGRWGGSIELAGVANGARAALVLQVER